MVRFIVPLQSAKASENWHRVSSLCMATLASITQQTHPDYEVVLVCNDVPVQFLPHPKIKVINVDFPVPEPTTEARMKDKWRKVRAGLAHFKGREDGYYMVVDGDDRVNRNLVEFVVKQGYKPGWYVDNGLIYDWGFPWVYKRKRFDLLCGTSSIVFCPEHLLPTGADDIAPDCCIVTYGHTRIKSYFDAQPFPLKAFPFYGAIYLSNTGENDSKLFYFRVKSRRQQLERILSIRLITRRLKEDFALWDI